MYSKPYQDISSEIVVVLEDLIGKYDTYHQGHRRRMARTLQVLWEAKPEGTLLEIGTSHLIPLALDKLFPDLTVVVTDFDLDKPKIGDLEASLNGHTKTVPCARVNIEDQALPFKPESFDYVLCSEVLEHMEVDPMFMLSEINRVTKQDGRLLLTTPNAVSTWSITKMLSGVEPYFYMQYRHDRSLYRHNYEYSIYSLMQVVRAAGFDGHIWTEDCFEDPTYVDIDRLKAAGYELKNLGDNLFTFANKKSDVIDRYPKVIYQD